MTLNKNNSATWLGVLLACLAALQLFDFTSFELKRDWPKLALCLGIAIKGYYVSFNEKSLNSKAKRD